MRAGEFLRINAPVLAFLAAAALATYFAVLLQGVARLAAIAVAWWSCSGMVMLLVDFARKREVFRRIVAQGLVAGPTYRAPPALRSTLCGWCIIWAARYHERRYE